MKILYVISRPLEINTSASVRNRATILGLLENGHTVDLFTTEPDKNHNAYDAKMSLGDSVATTYIKLGGAQSVARVGRRFRFLAPLRRLAYRFMKKYEVYDNLKGIANHVGVVSLAKGCYDLIISSSDPKSSHLFVLKLLEKQGADFHGRWIQIWGDPFIGDITLSAKSKQGVIRKEEHRLLSGADKVVYVSELTRNAQQKNYPDCADKMYCYPIPYMEECITENRDLREVDRVNLVYCGDYNSKVRNILPLYEAVKNMKNAHLTICGGSDMNLESCDNITVYPRVPYQTVVKLERSADILVHLSNLHGSQIPGKIYQYSGTNKPILFILDGDKEAHKAVFEPHSRYSFADNTALDISAVIYKIKNENNEYLPLTVFSKGSISQKIID